jgi:hypothetical protein
MSDDAKKSSIKLVESLPEDTKDLSSLWLSSTVGDDLTESVRYDIAFSKPRDFFRVHPDPAFRRKAEIYRHKVEGAIEEEYFILDRPMQGLLEEAAPYLIVPAIYRDGTPRLWPLRLPKEGERNNDAWVSARAAAKASLTKWVKLLWVGRAFTVREAKLGYAPDPAWEKLPSFDDLVFKALGPNGIIRDTTHSVYRNLIGAAPVGESDGGDL